MRVSSNAYTNSMLNQFSALAGQQYNLQSQVSSGLRVQAPSDDPAAMANTLSLASKKAANTQYSANISTLQDRGNLIYNVLSSLQTKTSRAGEIATSAATATASQSDLNGYAQEVNSMLEDTVKLGNSKDATGDQYLFGGTASGSAPFTVTRDANNNITGVTYNGNSTVNQAEIGTGSTASVDVPGVNNGTTGARGLLTDSQSGADMLNHLISLRDNLLAGNKTAITNTDSGNIQKDENNVAYQVASNGVMQNKLTAASSYISDTTTSLNTAIANQSSADLVQTMVELNKAQTGYQAALQSSAKIMNLSILNYIS
ncbi:MAG TPA: flagellar hook-associated protein FlgL [Verrucomicrobiae bacterium]|nr:flagellar hook-associated protein FlgL [Verrucomicrobiae bacterium]